jgi:hypothetical protein
MRLICRCWSIATVLPNQPMLLTLTKTVGACAGVGKARAQLLAKQVFVADVGRQPLALPGERRLAHRAAVEVAQRNVHQVE